MLSCALVQMWICTGPQSYRSGSPHECPLSCFTAMQSLIALRCLAMHARLASMIRPFSEGSYARLRMRCVQRWLHNNFKPSTSPPPELCGKLNTSSILSYQHYPGPSFDDRQSVVGPAAMWLDHLTGLFSMNRSSFFCQSNQSRDALYG